MAERVVASVTVSRILDGESQMLSKKKWNHSSDALLLVLLSEVVGDMALEFGHKYGDTFLALQQNVS